MVAGVSSAEDDYMSCDATELARRVATREVSPLELVATAIALIERVNPQLNAVVQTDLFKKRMADLGMSVPPAADNTPEKYEAYIRAEIVKQGEVAKIMGVPKPEPAK